MNHIDPDIFDKATKRIKAPDLTCDLKGSTLSEGNKLLGETRQLWSEYVTQANPSISIKPRVTISSERDSLNIRDCQFSEIEEENASQKDFALIDVLGEGGIGIVFSARQSSINRDVAIKLIQPEQSEDHDLRDIFVNEALAIGELDHPNIVPIHDLGRTEDGTLFYVMKQVHGKSWREVIKEKSRDENLEILQRVCDAVAFAHNKGFIHRDIKPENVMLGDFGEVLLMDWGLALKFREDSEENRAVAAGTPTYMAPEMALCESSKFGPRTDIYLLGGILYEIETGSPPHFGKDTFACLYAAANNVIQMTKVNNKLIDIAMKAMSTKLEDRHENVKEFQAALGEYQKHLESFDLLLESKNYYENAKKTGEYENYSQALFTCLNTLKLWPDNLEAREASQAIREDYALCAWRKGDFDLAKSQVDNLEDPSTDLIIKIEESLRERKSRRSRVKTMSIISFASLVMIVIVSLTAVYLINQRQQVATTARGLELVARRQAKEKEIEAKSSHQIAEEEKSRARSAEENEVQLRRKIDVLNKKIKLDRVKISTLENDIVNRRKNLERKFEAELKNKIALARVLKRHKERDRDRQDQIESLRNQIKNLDKRARNKHAKLIKTLKSDENKLLIIQSMVKIAANQINEARNSLDKLKSKDGFECADIMKYCQQEPILTIPTSLRKILLIDFSPNAQSVLVSGFKKSLDEKQKESQSEFPWKDAESLIIPLSNPKKMNITPGLALAIDDNAAILQISKKQSGIFSISRNRALSRKTCSEFPIGGDFNPEKIFAVSPKLRWFAFQSSENSKNLNIVDITGRQVFSWSDEARFTFKNIIFSIDNSSLFAASRKITRTNNELSMTTLSSWNLNKKKLGEQRKFDSIDTNKLAVISPLGNYLAAVDKLQKCLQIFHFPSGIPRKLLRSIPIPAEPPVFSEDERFIILIDSKGLGEIHDTATGEILKTITDVGPAPRFAPDNSYIIAPSRKNPSHIKFWNWLKDKKQILDSKCELSRNSSK